MTPAIIAAIVGCLSGLAGLIAAVTLYVKAKTETERIKAETERIKVEREKTARDRNEDSDKLHDAVLKLQFDVSQHKGDIKLLFDKSDDSNKQIALLNTQFATMLAKMDSVIAALGELKEELKEELKDRR